MVLAIEHHLLLDAVVDLDGEVDPHPDEDRQTRDGDQREWDAQVADQPERPDHADEHGQQREQAPADLEQQEEHHGHDREGQETELQHALLQVVVDLLQVDRRAGRERRGALDLERLGHREDRIGTGRQVVEAEVAAEHHAAHGGRSVGERRQQRGPDHGLIGGRRDHAVGERVPLVRVEQELDPGRIGQIALAHTAQARQAERDVGLTQCLGRRIGLPPGGRDQRGGARAGRDGLAPDDRGERREDRRHLGDRSEVGLELFEPLDVGRGEQVVDGATLVHREQQDCCLTAEGVLIADVVDRHLGAGVQVAVLAGGELQSCQTRHHRTRDGRDRDRHQVPPLAERTPEPPPPSIHDCPL